ncbi:hypothetical protein BDFB_010755 [Asbolus verrucosus]|uniref:DUF4729 domain-containing protein n=1 Tax=Asbolus verrucosus TaxID=1661398 RepID=A0A482VEE5_ASBVE|nr:hypothetical protein BDFB_010755 [Asbolus verrucosus]
MNRCSICNSEFQDAELLQSNQDEYFCKECFKCQYCAVLKKKKPVVSNRCEGDSPAKPRKMFSQAELLAMKEERERARVNSIFTSKRPLQCPHVDCNRYVSVFDLNAHFQHEHMEVPIAETALDARNPLAFYPRDVRYGVKQCLVLLSVLPPPLDAGTTTRSRAEKPKPPATIAVLASRIAVAHLGEESNECMVEDEEAASVVLGNNDKIIVWTSSNVVCDYSYTVAASTVCEDIRIKYYGPVLQLGDTPKKLCKEGHCLILSHFHFLGMSENGSKPLNLDVIIHSED